MLLRHWAGNNLVKYLQRAGTKSTNATQHKMYIKGKRMPNEQINTPFRKLDFR